MTALETTSHLLTFKEFIRSRGEDITYRGPQSFVHKEDVARISYRVEKPKLPHSGLISSAFPERTRFFQCEEPHCGKYRRVDAASCEVLSNAAWSKDELAEVRSVVLLHQANFDELLDTTVSRLLDSKVTLAHFHECQRNSLRDVPMDVKTTSLCRLFFLLEFLSALRKHEKSIGDDQLQKETEIIMDSVPGPLFLLHHALWNCLWRSL